MNPVFPRDPEGAARALRALGATTLLLASRLALPKAASALTEDPGLFYTVSGVLTLGLAAIAWILAGRPRPSTRGVPEGALTGLAAMVIAGVLGALLGVLGGPASASLAGVFAVGFYSLSHGLLTGLVMYTIVVSLPGWDPYEKSLAAGVVFALASVSSLIGQGALLSPNTMAIAASTIAIGSVAGLLADKHGPWTAAAYYTVLLAMSMLGPFTLGGSVLLGSALLAAGAMAGYGLVSLASGGLPQDLSGLRPPRPGRLTVAALLVLGVLAGLGLYAWSLGVMVWRPYAIVTGSMEPEISRGDIVILEKVDPDEIRVGDVITFVKGSTPVTHRVIAVLEDGFQTKGDANSAPDPYIVRPEEVVGRVRYVVPGLGWPIILLNWNPTVRILVILGSLAVIGWSILRR